MVDNKIKTPLPVYQLSIAADLAVFGRTEDGDQYTGEVYYIIATDAKGRRMAYNQSFPGCVKESWEDEESGDSGIYFDDIRIEAMEDATALMSSLSAGGLTQLSDADWHETHAVYGSAAYSGQAEAEWERERDEGRMS